MHGFMKMTFVRFEHGPPVFTAVAWLVSGVSHVSKVTLHRAQLILRWLTAGYAGRVGM